MHKIRRTEKTKHTILEFAHCVREWLMNIVFHKPSLSQAFVMLHNYESNYS